ncbi:hypothetical protein RFI_10314 [Reticulomyxa filosa]|uniref:Eukaryotic translation initiation factor 6 n=1 Tax=Reticulomyxa filosa TaxID=46433 RepID=X6NLN5_RETFI|nr:hypothetical protein RFI_10314 [Reticulomyxa filosa]|eukprot:ETO26823.1 hypothetical protein RFI_10314 [Reticulomyxa filosa]
MGRAVLSSNTAAEETLLRLEYEAKQLKNATLDMTDYCVQIIIMYTDRLTAYFSDYNTMKQHMARFSNAVFSSLGYNYNANVQLPIYSQMDKILTKKQKKQSTITKLALNLKQELLTFGRQFLGLLLFCCIFLMTSLALLLTYALLLNDVEERTYTYGMLRALGMKHTTVIQIMILKSLTFSIPGTAVALLVVFLIDIPLVVFISSYSNFDISYALPSVCIIIGVMVGFLTPLIAIYVPTRRALSKTLRDSLDVYHHVTSDIHVTMIYLQNLGLNPAIFSVALVLVLIGVVLSIGVPYAVFNQNWDLFFGIFGGLLLSMVYGMCLIASICTIPLSRFVAKLFLSCGPHRKLKDVVLKNISAHGGRNVKTGVMFIVCLGFVIFAGCGNAFLATSTIDFFGWLIGSDIQLISFSIDSPIDDSELRPYLEREKNNEANGKITDYTFVTFPISELDNARVINSLYLTSLAGTPLLTNWLVAVEKNYAETTNTKYLSVKSISKMHNPNASLHYFSNGQPDPVRLMYDDAGRQTLPLEQNHINVPPAIVSGAYYSDGTMYWTTIDNYNSKVDTLIALRNTSYTDYIDIIISTALASSLTINLNDPMMMHVDVTTGKTQQGQTLRYLCKVRSIVNKIGGLIMLPYSLSFAAFLAQFQNAVITYDSYKRIIADAYQLSPDIPSEQALIQSKLFYQSLLVKMKRGSTEQDYNEVKQEIRNFVPNQEIELTDIKYLQTQTQQNIALTNVFFVVLGAIGLILAFFILWLSFLSNIRSSSWELGVYRSIGLAKVEVSLIYVYEALALIVSCILFGTFIGIFTSFMLITQFNLFMLLDLDMTSIFPYFLYFSIVGLALLAALLGSLMPTRRYNKMVIADIHILTLAPSYSNNSSKSFLLQFFLLTIFECYILLSYPHLLECKKEAQSIKTVFVLQVVLIDSTSIFTFFVSNKRKRVKHIDTFKTGVQFGNSCEVGVFAKLTNAYCLVAMGGSQSFYSVFESELSDRIPVVQTTIADVRIIGRLVVGNTKGLLVPDTTTDQELQHLRNSLPDKIKIQRIEEKLSALGNCIITNDHVALVHPDIDKDTEELVADVLGVEVFRQSIAGESLVGSYAAISNRGGLVHPRTTKEELKELSNLLQIPITTGTVNRGSSVIGSGLIKNIFFNLSNKQHNNNNNKKRAFCGSDTTATEIGVIEQVFGLNPDEENEQNKHIKTLKEKILQKSLAEALT